MQSTYLFSHASSDAGTRSLQAIIATLFSPARTRRTRISLTRRASAFVSVAVVALLLAFQVSNSVLAAAGGSSVIVLPAVLTQASAGCATPSFASATSFDVGSFPQQVAVDDFNRDGKLDLVTANESTIDISVLLGDGKGGFGKPTIFAVGLFPRSPTTSCTERDDAEIGGLVLLVPFIHHDLSSPYRPLDPSSFAVSRAPQVKL